MQADNAALYIRIVKNYILNTLRTFPITREILSGDIQVLFFKYE
jgi:hypothetical protein